MAITEKSANTESNSTVKNECLLKANHPDFDFWEYIEQHTDHDPDDLDVSFDLNHGSQQVSKDLYLLLKYRTKYWTEEDWDRYQERNSDRIEHVADELLAQRDTK